LEDAKLEKKITGMKLDNFTEDLRSARERTGSATVLEARDEFLAANKHLEDTRTRLKDLQAGYGKPERDLKKVGVKYRRMSKS